MKLGDVFRQTFVFPIGGFLLISGLVSQTSTLTPTLNQADIDLLMQSMRLVFPTKVEFERRFEQVDQRFEQVDQRFEQMERRFEKIDQRFEQVDQRFAQIDQRFEQMEQRFTIIDVNFTEISQRFDEIEQQQSIKYDNVITLLDDVLVELKPLREEQVVLAHHSQRHTGQIGKMQSRATNHEKRIKKLEVAADFV